MAAIKHIAKMGAFRLFAISLVIIVVMCGLAVVRAAIGYWLAVSPLTGMILAGLSLFAGAYLLWYGLRLLLRDAKQLSRLSAIEHTRDIANKAIKTQSIAACEDVLSHTVKLVHPTTQNAKALARLEHYDVDSRTAEEVIATLEEQLLKQADDLCFMRIKQRARAIAVASALTPNPVLDFIAIVAGHAMIVYDIAKSYDIKPGPLTYVRLCKSIFKNVMFAGLVHVADGMSREILGKSLSAAAAKRVGRGIFNGLMALKFGQIAVNTCRPLPFVAHKPPTLAQLAASSVTAPLKKLASPETEKSL